MAAAIGATTADASSSKSSHMIGNMIEESTQPRTLVLLDNWATVETHSMFFDHLSEKLDHEVRFAMMDQDWLDYKELD